MAAAAAHVPDFTLDSFRLLVESVEDYAIFMLDVDGRVLTWNRGAHRIKGYSADEIIGRPFSLFYTPEDLAAHKPQNELRLAQQVGRVEDEGFRLRKDGTRFWANVVITALRDEHGRLRGFGKVTRDLTERRDAAEELRRSEERFRLLLAGIRDYAVYMLDPTGHVTTWNVGAESIKGYRADEILGKHYSTFFTPDDVAAGRPQTELSVALAAGRYEEEGYRVRKDGTRFWANVVLTPLRNDAGALVGFAKITRDLTARKRAEETVRELSREQAARAAAEQAEWKLREERERYKALSRRLEVILEAIADGITVQDRSGSVIFANSAAARMFGVDSPLELLSAPLRDDSRFQVFDEQGSLFPLDQLPGDRVLGGEPHAHAVLRICERTSGRAFWCVVRATPVRGDSGEVELSVNVLHDVSSERRREAHEGLVVRATAALSSSLDAEIVLRALSEVLVPDLADWCLVHVREGAELNLVSLAHASRDEREQARRFREHYRPSPDTPRGIWAVLQSGEAELHEVVDPEVLLPQDSAEEPRQLLRELGIKSLIIVPIRIHGRVFGTLSLLSTSSGRRFDRLDCALGEELGRRAGATLENVRLYAAERSARERLELIARAGETLSATLDYEATLRNVVEVALPVLGDFALLDVIEGERVRRLSWTHDDPELEALLAQLSWLGAELGEDRNALYRGRPVFEPTIDEAWLRAAAVDAGQLDLLRRVGLNSMISVPMSGRGKLLGALTLCFGKSARHHTLEDLRLAEELARRAAAAVTQALLFAEAQEAAAVAAAAAHSAEDASRVKDEFLATVSHELRTPLNAIVGWASMLRGRSEDAAIAKGLEVIHRNAQAQGKIIEDILDVSRIITGKLRLDVRWIDPRNLVQNAIEVVRPSAAAKAISISFEVPSADCSLPADPERLQQVVWNLLSNAVKFTPPGGSVRIRIERGTAELRLSVSDSGQGIDASFLPHVFDRFKQADGSTTRRFGGLGLGLSIVRHIVELHGGQVSASSSGSGQGATFLVVLPVQMQSKEEPEQAAPRGQDEVREAAGAILAGLRVLVVDDEPDTRELLQALLENAGARVNTAASASEALELLTRFRPEVLISDIGMPHEDGYTLMRRIRELDPALGGGIPSIALTAYARSEDTARALGVGFTTHMGKPVNPDELLAAVANLARLSPKPVRA